MVEALSLAELRAHDPHPQERGREHRFLCPLPGCAEKQHRRHQSLAVNAETGAFFCHRCSAKGKLSEHWEQRPPATRTQRKNEAVRRAFAVPPIHQEPSTAPIEDAHELGVPIEDAPAAMDYLIHRCLPSSVVVAAGVRYVQNWYGRPAIVLPMRDEQGAYVAANGRYIDGLANTQGTHTRTRQRCSFCVFWRTETGYSGNH